VSLGVLCTKGENPKTNFKSISAWTDDFPDKTRQWIDGASNLNAIPFRQNVPEIFYLATAFDFL